MTGRRTELLGVLGGLALLSAVSLYRQLSLHFLPGDPARPCVVYAVYLVLLLGWVLSIRSRFTQRSMRLFLFIEAFIMLLWLTVRFVQEALVAENIGLVRALGYFIHIPAVAVPLLGLYAAFGLGRGDDYRFSRMWYLLVLPAGGLIALALTDERRHFLYRLVAGETQPNLYFHPGCGIYIIYGWGFALIALRTAVIFRRSRPVKKRSVLQRLSPFLEPMALLAFCAPYTASSFWVRREFIEFSAGMFFIEAASWELFIYLGLIPVNTQYKTVFDRSTAAMQIISDDGRLLVRSASAPALTAEQAAALLHRQTVTAANGQELQAYQIQNGCFVWQRDVAQLRSVIGQLRKTAAALRQESGLLAQELKLKSEKSAVDEQNRIYNRLTLEVGPQLRLLRQLLDKQDTVPDRESLFREICLIGAYIKRRCSLRLIEQTDGSISGEDLELSFRELADRLSGMGADVCLRWSGADLPSAQFALLCFDVFEFLLEYQQFALLAAEISLREDAACSIFVRPAGARAPTPPDQALSRMAGNGFTILCEGGPAGYTVLIREGGKNRC